MGIKNNLNKHRLSFILSWSWAVLGFMIFFLYVRLSFLPGITEQFSGNLVFASPLLWGSCAAYFVVAWYLISARKLPYSNTFEILFSTALTLTCLLLLFLAAAREYYSGTYLTIFLLFQLFWFGLEVFFRNRFIQYKLAIFPTDIELRQKDFANYLFFFPDSPGATPPGDIDAAVVDFNKEMDRQWIAGLAEYQNAGVPILQLTAFLENVWGRIPVELIKSAKIFETAHISPFLIVKPLVDRVAAFLALVVLLPVLTLTALLVRVTSKGSVLFCQQRVGLGGRPFTIYKFRTMQDGADKLGSFSTTSNDERLTVIGGVLRKYHLDELPQLFNVVKGDMAIVGPRPETVELTKVYSEHIDYYSVRTTMKPGLTSWALIHQGNVSGVEATKIKLSYDLYYFKHASFLVDFFIILKTIWVLLIGIETLKDPGGLRLFGTRR